MRPVESMVFHSLTIKTVHSRSPIVDVAIRLHAMQTAMKDNGEYLSILASFQEHARKAELYFRCLRRRYPI